MKRRAWILASLCLVGCGSSTPLQPLDQGSYAEPPATITLKIKNYVPQAGATLQHLFVTNQSVRVKRGALYFSKDRDGLTDEIKTQAAADYGFTLDTPESVVTGFADALLFKLGIKTPSQSVIHCASTQMQTSTGDGFEYADERLAGSPTVFLGLRDCEKAYLNLDPSKFDNAGNGIPDSLKLRCGLNPQTAADAFVSTAGDGVANIDKCKQNIPIDENAYTQPNQLFAYHYETRVNDDGTTDFTIGNIPVLNGGVDNFVSFMIVEQNLTTRASALYTAFVTTRADFTNRVVTINYWATAPANFTNQRITVP